MRGLNFCLYAELNFSYKRFFLRVTQLVYYNEYNHRDRQKNNIVLIARVSFQILSSVVDDYYPWGKPGHGAPNDDGLRKRKIFMDPPSPPWKVRDRYKHAPKLKKNK